MEEAHHWGETGSFLGSGLKETHRRLFLGGGLKRSQPASEVPIGGSSIFFINDSRRIYSLLQTSSARCFRSCTAGLLRIEITDGTDAVVICLGEKRKEIKFLKNPFLSVL